MLRIRSNAQCGILSYNIAKACMFFGTISCQTYACLKMLTCCSWYALTIDLLNERDVDAMF